MLIITARLQKIEKASADVTSVERAAYRNARRRCTNPKAAEWSGYGGRGIEFRFHSFAEFIAHIGPKPSLDLSLDRIDNDGHYEIGNVRWATQSQQMRNTRSPNRPDLSPAEIRRRQLAQGRGRRYSSVQREVFFAEQYRRYRQYFDNGDRASYRRFLADRERQGIPICHIHTGRSA